MYHYVAWAGFIAKILLPQPLEYSMYTISSVLLSFLNAFKILK